MTFCVLLLDILNLRTLLDVAFLHATTNKHKDKMCEAYLQIVSLKRIMCIIMLLLLIEINTIFKTWSYTFSKEKLVNNKEIKSIDISFS